MSKQDTAPRALQKSLGDAYSIRTIDWEKCLYRDFGNGFNVEISGVHTSSEKKPATLYLWYGDKADCIAVRAVSNVPRGEIVRAVDELYAYSQQLIRDGLDKRAALINLIR